MSVRTSTSPFVFLAAIGLVLFLKASWSGTAVGEESGVSLANEDASADLLNQFEAREVPREPRILSDDGMLRETLASYGPVSTMQALREEAALQGTDCHNRAHELGRMGFEEFGSAVFKLNIPECHSGFYHGAIEAFFRENGTARLAQNLVTICQEGLTGFFTHQCLHGIGHGLMAWSDYDLPSSLEYCNLIPPPSGKSSCRTGVFMENIVGSLDDSPEAKERGHITTYLSPDPHFPCTIVKEEYKGDCYFLQTDRMLALSAAGFQGVAEECAKAPQAYRHLCFSSMGRTIGGIYRGKPLEAIHACAFIEDTQSRVPCILGAAQDTFWDKNGETLAHEFCSHVAENEGKKECYQTIIGRSGEILSRDDQLAFCSRLPDPYRSDCHTGIL